MTQTDILMRETARMQELDCTTGTQVWQGAGCPQREKLAYMRKPRTASMAASTIRNEGTTMAAPDRRNVSSVK